MTQKSAFDKDNIKSKLIQPEAQTGLLEELNLPPKIVSFIRKNDKQLKAGIIGIVVIVLGWVFYDYYTEQQRSKSSSMAVRRNGVSKRTCPVSTALK